jgi:acetyl esterase/lipase
MQAAAFTAVRAIGGPWDPIAQTMDAQATMRAAQTKDAAGRVLILRDVPYVRPSEVGNNVHKQMLDVHLPAGPRCGLPLLIHFHGGGWVHGDRRHEMFGAPAVARSLAAAGCVVVTPSYRLGNSDDFMLDAQRAVLWAVTNAAALGADPDALYLSGHSAGGNIAALLGVGAWLAPPVLPPNAVKGVIGISGVYTLLRPLGGMLSCYKNHIFDRYMRKRVFGDEVETLARYSPTALVRMGAGDGSSPFKPRWFEALGKLAHSTVSMVSITSSTMAEQGPAADHPLPPSWAEALPPVLLLNASWDLGLEDDAAYFAKILAARTGTKPAHHIIPDTNHATVSWDVASFRRCRDFIASCEAGRAGGEAALVWG